MTDAPERRSDDAGGFLAPPPDALPFSRCIRCGRVTPVGVALCPEHNPGAIRAPSATQLHATVLAGVLAGIAGFLVVARLAVSPGGPWQVSMLGSGFDGAGGVALAFALVNEGADDGVATCRVTRDGVPRPGDVTFRTQLVGAGQRALVERSVPDALGAIPAYDPERMTVVCQ